MLGRSPRALRTGLAACLTLQFSCPVSQNLLRRSKGCSDIWEFSECFPHPPPS